MKTKEEKNIYMKKWREENKDKVKEYNQRPERKAKQIGRGKKRQEDNPDYNKTKSKEWREENKEEIKSYNQTPKRKAYEKARRKTPEAKAKAKIYNQRSDVKARLKEWTEKQREEENKRRKKLNLPLVGEGWVCEKELLNYVTNLFPNYEIIFHNRSWSSTQLELDIYIPTLKLAFEYNGKQHYEWIKFFHPTELEFKYRKYKDRMKKRLCKFYGITLIKIKYDEELSEQLILTKLKYVKLPIVQERLKNDTRKENMLPL